MASYTCLSNEAGMMFTPGKQYPVEYKQGNGECIRDDYGYIRFLLISDARFIVKNNAPYGSVFYAYFERNN